MHVEVMLVRIGKLGNDWASRIGEFVRGKHWLSRTNFGIWVDFF